MGKSSPRKLPALLAQSAEGESTRTGFEPKHIGSQPNTWFVDHFARELATASSPSSQPSELEISHARRQLREIACYSAQYLKYIELDSERASQKNVSRKAFITKTKAAIHALRALRRIGNMRIEIDLSPVDVGLPEADAGDLLFSWESSRYSNTLLHQVDHLVARLVEIEARASRKSSTKGRHRPCLPLAAAELMKGVDDILLRAPISRPWALVEAVWRDAEFGSLSGKETQESYGPEFQKALRKFMKQEGIRGAKSLGKKSTYSPPDIR